MAPAFAGMALKLLENRQNARRAGALALRRRRGSLLAPVPGAASLAFAAAGFAAFALLRFADLAAAALVGLGLAGGRRIHAGAHHLDRQGDDVDRGPGEAARQQNRCGEKQNDAHLQTDSGRLLDGR